MANQWFRMYHEFATDPKVQMLSEADQRRFVMLLCLKCCNGDVTLQDEEAAFQLRISNEEFAQTKQLLIEKGLIDETLTPTAWDKRQYASDSSAARVRKHREKKKQGCNVTETKSNALDTEADTETDTTGEKNSPASGSSKIPNCPHQTLVNLYHEKLSQLPKVQKLTDARKGQLRSLWQEHPSLNWWERYFEYIAQSDFLCGRADGRNGQPPFVADLEWITKPSNHAKIIEGKYHRQGVAA